MSTLVHPHVEKVAIPELPKGDSCLLVIFGATGDLAKRKLIPALYDLACIGCTNRNFDVLGVGRTPLTDEQFRERMHEAAAHSKDARNYNEGDWKQFEARLHYLIGDANQRGFLPAPGGPVAGTAKAGRERQHSVLRFHSCLAGAAHRRRPRRIRFESQRRRLDAHCSGEALRPRPAERP